MGEASRKKKAQKDKKWELMEHVVSILEGSLAQDCEVLRNQFLVNHQTAHMRKKPHKRQCDVVIKQGKPPREVFTIVEVQKRARNVEYKEYSSWVTKMNQVGAAGLICVAEKGFPPSVIDDAKLHGGRVKLLTLTQLEGPEWPVHIADKSMYFSKLDIRLQNVHVVLAVKVKPTEQPTATPIGPRKFRRLDTGAPVTAEWLSQETSKSYRDAYDRGPDGEFPGVKWEFVPTSLLPVEMEHGAQWYPVNKITFTVDLTLRRHCFPLTCSEYKPIEFGPILAYALTAAGVIDGSDIHITAILRPTPDKKLRYMGQEVKGFPEGAQIGMAFLTSKPGSEPKP